MRRHTQSAAQERFLMHDDGRRRLGIVEKHCVHNFAQNLNSTLQFFSFLPQRKSKTPTDDLFLKVTAIPSRLVLRRGWQERGKGFLRESEENSLTQETTTQMLSVINARKYTERAHGKNLLLKIFKLLSCFRKLDFFAREIHSRLPQEPK